MSTPLGLPPISPNLKAITPYLQRADELFKKEPVIAYWCAYYAAQVGISQKAKDAASRNCLFELLAVLERLKKEIGPNDAVDIESASAAYVENFALKVFTMADNEDRKGDATRATAKKFLAAANFLEVLKVFPKSEISESTEMKIKYAKWKAADIAKAFREGRKPTPGPADSDLDSALFPSPPADPASSLPPPSNNVTTPAASSSSNNSASPPRTPKRVTPPPHMKPEDIARANMPHTHPRPPAINADVDVHADADDALSPGRWSTTATPGFDVGDRFRTSLNVSDFSDVNETLSGTSKTKGSSLKKTWVSAELEGAGSDGEAETATLAGSPPRSSSISPSRKVHFAQSNGGAPSSSPINIPPGPPHDIPLSSSSPVGTMPSVPPPPHATVSVSPPSFSAKPSSPPKSTSPNRRGRRQSLSTGKPDNLPHNAMPPHTIPSAPFVPVPPPPVSSSVPPHLPPVSQYPYHPPPPPSAPDALPSAPPAPPDLTPSIIAKAQKHCRFAISALDYEDAEQAKKELRAALAMLGE